MLSTSAFASGYGLRDVSAATLGLSYAGAAANGTTASTLAFNPALLADVKDFDVAVSSVGLLPDTNGQFTAANAAGQPVTGGNHPTDIVNTALIPSVSLRYRISEQFTAGIAMTAPWGMITDYGPDWVGRYYATMSDVKTFNATPMLAWQPVPEFSIGVGLQVQYIKGKLGKAIDFGTIGYSYHIPGALPGNADGSVILKAQDWSEGWVIGAQWKPRPDLSLGISYRSRVDNTLSGKEEFSLDSKGIGAILKGATGAFADGPTTAAFNNPAVLTFGARWQASDRLTILAGGDWTQWDAFDTLIAHSANPHQPDDVSLMGWKNSWFGSIGAEYKLDKDWTLRVGTAYDETPTQSGTRTPGIPDGSRYWVSAGAGYRLTDNMDVDLSIARLIAQKGNIALKQSDLGNAMRGSLNGYVNMQVTLIGVEFSYHL
jgi:long-chain fatty acid transport protein